MHIRTVARLHLRFRRDVDADTKQFIVAVATPIHENMSMGQGQAT
jgi:hypothetical protein